MFNWINISKQEFKVFAIITLWFIVKLSFYRYVGLPDTYIFRNISIFFAVFIYFYCAGEIVKFKEHKEISLIALSAVIGLFMSIVYWGASPWSALKASAGSLGLLYVVVYFFLKRNNATAESVKYSLIVLSVIYILCWLYALYRLPELTFGADRDGEMGEITKRGFYRLFIPGNISAVLSFYFLSEFLNKGKKYFAVLAFLMLVVVILHVTRQLIAWTVVLSALMVFVKYKKKVGYLFLAVIVTYAGFRFLAQEIPAVSAMINMTEKQTDNFDDDIRLEAATYYLSDYPHDVLTSFLGNGSPADGSELYKIYERAQSKDYWMEDIGYIALFCNYGLLAIIAFALLLKKVIIMKVEPEYEFLKYYIYFLFGVYLMTQALTSNIFTLAMAYYALEQSAKRLEENNAYASIQQD